MYRHLCKSFLIVLWWGDDCADMLEYSDMIDVFVWPDASVIRYYRYYFHYLLLLSSVSIVNS